MESPVKQPVFVAKEKENVPKMKEVAVPVKGIPMFDEPAVAESKGAAVADTIKPEEADEPLLKENPNRFVLFPIQNHEVRAMLQIKTRVGRVIFAY